MFKKEKGKREKIPIYIFVFIFFLFFIWLPLMSSIGPKSFASLFDIYVYCICFALISAIIALGKLSTVEKVS